MKQLRRWYRELGVLGGCVFLLVLAFTTGTDVPTTPADAGTCVVSKTWVFDELLTETDLNGNFEGLASCVNGNLDNSNIATGAAIDQDKLETLYNNSVFTDNLNAFLNHDTRHAPNGADELNDLDIANSGTNVSLHASRHATGGPDPIPAGAISASMLSPGLLTAVGGLLSKNADTATMTETTYTMDVRPTFNTTLSTNGAAVDMVQCAGVVYVLESGATDRVWRVNPDLSAATPPSVNLTAGDDPYDIECAPDGNVYITTNNAGSGRALKKLTVTGTLSTVVNLSSDLVCGGLACGADNLAKMTIDPNGTYAFIIGQDGTETVDQFIFRVPLAGGNVEKYQPATAAANNAIKLTDLAIVTRNALTRLWVGLQEDDGGGNDWCCIFEVNQTATPMTGDSGVQCGGAQTVIAEENAAAGLVNSNACNTFEHNGTVMYVSNTNGSSLWKMGDLARVGNAGTALNTTASIDPRYNVFNGRWIALQQNDADIDYFQTEDINYITDTTLLAANLSRDWHLQTSASRTPCGLSTDGTYMYICTDQSAGANLWVTRIFIF